MDDCKNKLTVKRALALIIALVMAVTCLPAVALAEEPAPADESGNVHVLEAKNLTAFSGGKEDGATENVGDYFTIIYSAKSKVDGSTKSWADGYESNQRINFGGKAATTKNSVKFTTSGKATVKIWWVQGGKDNREMAILSSDGNVAAQTTGGTYEQNSPYLSTLELENAGTYFLGGLTNNNYIFKVEVEETPAEVTHVLEAKNLTAFSGGKEDGATENVGDYFTIIYSAKSKVDGSTKSWADGYESNQRINFGGKAATTKNSVKFTTSGKATVKIWWVQGGKDNREMAILSSDGNVAAQTTGGTYEQNSPYLSTLELENAGTYFLGGLTNNNYIFKVEVTEGGGTKPPRADWADVDDPSIISVEVDAEDPGKVNVTVSGQVGYDYADQITVTMLDADGWELKSQSSLAEKSEHTLSFSPESTGEYTFKVQATRNDETDVHEGAEAVSFSFTYPLGVPVMKYAVNDGKGGLTVEWNSVKEATGYIVNAGGKTVTTTGNNATRATVPGMTVGDTVEVTVTAVRDSEVGEPCAAFEVAISAEAEIAWVFSAFGTSTNTTNNGYEIKGEDSVRVFSTGGKGKIQPSAEDGLAFYYTSVDPDTTNFVLTATANVNTWTYSNGQEGFGLGVLDQVGVNGSTAPVITNSFMVAVTGLSTVSNKRLGVGALARKGVTEYTSTAPTGYGTWLADMSGISDEEARNLVGNCTNQSSLDSRGATIDPPLTSFKLKLEKNDEGYFVTYTDHNGIDHTEKYPDNLSQVDDYVYVGLLAARNMDVTFTDISFTTSAASGSTAPGEEEDAVVDPSYSFKNPTVSNREKFYLDFRSNADGRVTVTDSHGNVVYRGVVEAGEKLNLPVALAIGGNTFTAVMTPDPGYITADGARLSSYDSVELTTTVTRRFDNRTVIYVSPDGDSYADGTINDPTTLDSAVVCPAPGTTIILMEGTYHLSSGVTVDRGINGTSDSPITLMADPDAKTRPVLDWGESGNGLRINGDWWYLYGFDSTHSTAKGVHVGGNYNVVERVCVYDNLNTGLSISRINFGDSIPDWPSYNIIKNCSSWLNADAGYEDADGFEAKLTVGVGNVFDGCIAAYNADDGWDLFARGATIGAVTIRNSIAFKNGYDIVDGKEVNAGNGNGFKLGGGNIPVDHKIIDSVAFANKANGFTCNSNPNVKVENCTGYDNLKGNLALYTNVADLATAFEVTGFISYKGGSNDSIKGQSQSSADYIGDTNYYQGHSSGAAVSDDWFKSVDTNAAITTVSRNEDGSINLHDYLVLTDKAPEDAGAVLGRTTTQPVVPVEPDPEPDMPDEPSTPSRPSTPSTPTTPADPDVTTSGGETTIAPDVSTGAAEVTEELGGKLVEQTKDKGSDTAVVAPEFDEDADSAAVSIPGSTVKDLGDKTDADLRVETPVADVTIPNEALSELGKGESVSVAVEKTDDGVTVTVAADNEVVETVPGGLKVAVDLGDGQVAVLVGDDGTETVIPKSIVENGITYVILKGSGTVKAADNDKDFADVKAADWFSSAVDFVASHKLFEGTTDTTFAPDTVMDRAMVATVLWRLESEADAGAAATFPDVDADKWYTKGVAWASENGIVLGKDGGMFGTSDPVTRQELAVMLSRYAKLMGIDTSAKASLSSFADGAKTDTWAQDAMMWAVSAGLLEGSNGKLNPTGTASRAEVATILQRMVGLLVK